MTHFIFIKTLGPVVGWNHTARRPTPPNHDAKRPLTSL